jgi:hypothetical protein
MVADAREDAVCLCTQALAAIGRSISSATKLALEGFGHRFDAVILPPVGKRTSSVRNITHSFCRSTVGQVAQHPGQVHFCISGLEAALHRSLDSALGLGLTESLDEEIGITTEILGRRERERR